MSKSAKSRSANDVNIVFSFDTSSAYSPANEQNQFYSTEELVRVGKETIPLYLCYVAKKSSMPHVITTSSPLGQANLSLQAHMGYWPSYNSISNDDRATYLLWHKTGRKDPNADIGFVFLYFYGLEYRAIKDEQNHFEIYKELIRLSEIYSDKSGSFSGYCTAFISWLILKNPTWNYKSDISQTKIPVSSSSLAKEVLWRSQVGESPVASKALRTDSLQIPRSLINYSNDIIKEFSLALSTIDIKESDFKNESKSDYYRTATALRMNPTVDVNTFRPNAKTKRKLEILWESIIEKHDVFRKVQKMDPAIASLVTPNGSSSHIKSFIDFKFTKQCSLSELMKSIGSVERPSLTSAESKAISLILEENGVLIEPDANITNRGLKYNEEIILYKGSNGEFRLDAWKNAVVLLDISAAIAFSDEQSEGAEIKHTIDFIVKQFKLNQTEATRLEMRSIILKKTKISAYSTAKKLGSTMNPKEASVLAKFFFSIAAHDGSINSMELKALEKTFKAMEIPITSLDLLVKEFTENQKGTLVTLKTASKKSTKSGSAIPKEDIRKEAETIILNQAALDTALADAAEVSRILSEVFTEEVEIENEISSSKETAHPSEITHLGAKENSILTALVKKERWEVSEAEDLCRRMGMMYGAFLNRVNDYYEQKIGTPVLEEDGDELVIALDALSNEVQIA